MKPARSFASDNNASVHPLVLKAIAGANHGHAVAYGDDPHTARALRKFRRHFGSDSQVFFVFNGTAANCLSLRVLVESYEAVICSQAAHIYSDECGAPERFAGCKLLPVAPVEGKLTAESIATLYRGVGDQHHVQPRVISITQATEVGTVYKPEEIRALARFAHERDMFLHMDGARLANAAAHLGLNLRQATRDLGIDVLSFGGTKNGLMGAEAVVLFPGQGISPKFGERLRYLRKQSMQLASKMRFLAAQFDALLTGNLWLENARHANGMAALLAEELRKLSRVKIVYEVEGNGIFALVPRPAVAELQKRYFFYVWDEEQSMVRWMCSFDTTEGDVKRFSAAVKAAVGL
jgi:threonine aldolase